MLRYNLAQVYRKMGEWPLATREFLAYLPHASASERRAIEEVVPAIERRAQAERTLAVEFASAQQARDLRGMQQAAQAALAYDDQYWLAHFYLSLTLQQLATPDARRMFPDLPDIRELLEQALTHLTIALRLEPKASMLRTRAQLLANMRDFSRAAADYTILIEHLDNAEDRMARAQAYYRAGRDAEAIDDLRTVIRMKPELREALEAEIRRIESERR